MHKDLKIALFCGGSGTRMWPMSRKNLPKQFQALVGDRSLFQQAVDRVKKGFPIKDIYVVTGRNQVGLVLEQEPELPLENIIIEPEMRDMLAAFGYAATVLDKKFKNPIVASLWTDHLVRNNDVFISALKHAYDYVSDTGKIVSIDVRPTYPNVHVGYIQIGKMIKKLNNMAIFEYVRQVEKPDLATAKKFIKGWEYLWHAGYKVWHTQKMLSFYQKFQPKAYNGLMKIHAAWGSDKQEQITRKVYPDFEKISVDYAIFEKIDPKEIVVLSADLGWSDVGAWNILKEELSDNQRDNVIKGEVLDLGSTDSLLYEITSGKMAATIGLDDLIVVDTPDVLLVCKKDRVSDIKKIIEKLREAKKEKYL
ncbi:mannose-1-phosphate guanylyltransferase [Candidatus Curtissbacteria bacterium]|nr:mannose-1-phosphate guanylyltransferase [Candidatus Curtissbacteria bacterium]